MFDKALGFGSLVVALMGSWLLAAVARPGGVVRTVETGGHTVVVREARPVALPPVPGSQVGFDCNNALVWDGGTLFCFSSHEHPFRSAGPDLFRLGHPAGEPPAGVTFDALRDAAPGGRWIEAVHRAADGRLFMWYHLEPKGLFPGNDLTEPRVGQMVSADGGKHWRDQGVVLQAPAGSSTTETPNRFFAGGHGDFSVVPDETGEYFYLFFSSYTADVTQQGVAAARLAARDLDAPAGKAVKWYNGRWSEPGVGGKVTPVFPAGVSWHRHDASAFWGPSVHRNTHLNAYVMVMNRARDAGWAQEGVYVAVAPRLDDPSAWSRPEKLLNGGDWYPQVIGTNPDPAAAETDRKAGRVARLFVKGRSAWEIEFR